MTNRVRWLMFCGLAGLVAGAARGQYTLALLSLSTLVWILLAWLRFQVRVVFELPRLRFTRSVNGRNEASGLLWAGRQVHIQVDISGPWAISQGMLVVDVAPDILEILLPADTQPVPFSATHGDSRSSNARWPSVQRWFPAIFHATTQARKAPNQWSTDKRSTEASFNYVARVRAAGQLTLPGMRLTLTDRHGFFQYDRFYQLPQTFRILPDYFQSGELKPTVKRHNSLPRHGIHRLQRAGAGSELLELQEYADGDPPKSIAWKVSARRDKLMTRKYESEVPVRVQLLIDGSSSTRIGGYGRRLLDQMNYVAASVAKAATSVGDPIGGMFVDAHGVKRLPWMSGDRGFLQLLKALADFAHCPPPAQGNMTSHMLQCAVGICHQRFPELWDRHYLRTPFTLWGPSRQRYRIAGVLAELYDMSPREQVECFYDSACLARALQLFLHDSGLPWMAPIHPLPQDPAVAGLRNMQLLAEAMGRLIAHARDNEVYVVFADLLNSAMHLSTLLRVVKLAIAKHHRVVFVCPSTTFLRPNDELIRPASDRLDDLILAAEQTRVRELAMQLKRELVRLGVSVSFSGERSAIQMVLAEMELARDGRTRFQGSRA